MKKLLLLSLLIISLSSYGQDTVKLAGTSVVGIRGDSKTPISQKIITKAEINKIYQGQEMTYILSTTPSITYQSDGGQPNGYTTFRLRGIDQTRVNITLNSCSLSDQEDQGVYFSNYPDFATNIQTMQIQRGVGTSSNGVSSFGGSINFESQNGLDKGGMVQLGYGAFNTSHFNISNSTGLINKKFSLFTSLSGYNSDGYKYHSGGKGYSGFVSTQYYIGKDVIKFTGFSGRALNDMAWYAVAESDINKNPRRNDNPKGESDNFSQSFGQLQYVKTFNSNSYITTTAFYNRLDGTWGMFVDSINLLHYNLHSNFYGLISNYHLQVTKLKFDFGIGGNAYNRTHSAVIPSESPDNLYLNTGYKKEISSYVKLSYDIDKFTLFGDLQERYVNFKYHGDVQIPTLHWNFINPKGGITYTYNNNVNYYISVGESHREPTRTDLFGGNDNLTLPLGSTIPERVIDYELGTNIKYTNLYVQANLYYMDFHNEITLLGALGTNGLPLMTQIEKSFRSGVEVDIKYKISKHFILTNNTNISRNYFTNNETKLQPLYTPRVTSNQGVGYTQKDFSIGLSVKYQSRSYVSLDNKYDAPAFVIFNANVNYKLNNFTIMVQDNNITNKKYFTNGYVIDNQKYFFVNAPRSVYVTLKYNW